MKKHFLLFLALLLFTSISCTQNTTVKGDLYFGLWRYGSFYKQPKKVVKGIEDLVHAEPEKRDSFDLSTKEILRIYDVLQKENLLYAPYVQLKLDNDSIVRIYFQKKDYRKIRKYKLADLLENKEKIRIELEGREMGEGLIYCEKLVTVSIIEGQTFCIPRKFAIEDYP